MAQDRTFEKASENQDNPNRRNGRNYLLVIGIDRYSSVLPLRNAVKDAKAVTEVLQERYLFEEKNTLQLYDKEATREEIIRALDKFAEKITPDDSLLIYYAGHGYYRTRLRIGYWVPVHGEEGEYSSFINHSTIQEYIQSIPAHHTFLIVDSCFSGNMIRNRGRDLSPTVVYSDRVDEFPSRWCLAAGMIENVSDGFIGDHSPFAQSLITFLEKNTEARFPVQDLVTHVCKATSYNADQTPIGGVILKTGDQNGQFVFELKRDDLRDWKAAKKIDSISSYEQYRSLYPAGKFAEEALWKISCKKNSSLSYSNYLGAYPVGAYEQEAKENQRKLEIQQKQAQKKEEQQKYIESLDAARKAMQRGERKEALAYVNIAFGYSSVIQDEAHLVYKQILEQLPSHKSWVSKIGTGKGILIVGGVLIVLIFIIYMQWFKIEEPGKASGKSHVRKDSVKYTTMDIPIDTSGPSQQMLSERLANMVFIKGGKYRMGNLFDDGYKNEKPVHEVIVNSFLIGKYEVTFDEYDAYCDADSLIKPDAEGWGRGKRPIINVSWLDAVKYCNWLSSQKGYKQVYKIARNVVTSDWTANGYRLPTEAEWEFVAKGRRKGKGFIYSGSNEIDHVAWYSSNSGRETHLVNIKKKANELGLMHMSGNVWEWCWDRYGKYPADLMQNPIGPEPGSGRVMRGGSWGTTYDGCRLSYRRYWSPDAGDNDVGFRLARSL